MMGTSKSYFDEISASWDEVSREFFSESLREKAFAVAGVEGGRVAADVGVGTGFITEGLVKRGVRCIAINQSAAMLQALRSKFPGKRPGRLQNRHG